MPTQAEFVHKWGVSKGIISRYHNRGMPLSSYDAAEAWVSSNVPFGKVHCAAEEARLGPTRVDLIPWETPVVPARSEEDAEMLRVEKERDQLLCSAWKRFKKNPVHAESQPRYSDAELLVCWAIQGLMANGISEQDAFDFASFAAIVTSAGNGCGWEPMPERRKAS